MSAAAAAVASLDLNLLVQVHRAAWLVLNAGEWGELLCTRELLVCATRSVHD